MKELFAYVADVGPIDRALTGLQVNPAQLQVAANNISNAQNPGFTEKSASISSLSLGNDAGGVEITGFTRATNAGLTNSYNAATGDASYYSTQSNYLAQVQTILNSSGNPPALSDAYAQFQSAWTQFAAAPEDPAQQQSVIQAANNLASQIKTAAQAVQKLGLQVTSDTTATVTSLNNDLQQVAALNQQIATAGSGTQSAVNLEDQRDTLINNIAAITNVTVLPRNAGQIALYTPNGQLLLDGTPQTFTYNGSTVVSSGGQDVTNVLTGGSLQAELQFNFNGSPAAASTLPGSEVIRKLNSQLTELASALTDATSGSPATFANAYNNATTGSGELASNFFTVTLNSGVPDPTTLAVNANLLNGTNTIKEASGAVVPDALAAARNFTADGLTVTSGTYGTLVSDILAGFQQAANTVKGQSTTATQQQGFYQQSLSNATGVNVDNELVVTTLQNSYAASAHVISTINQMLQELIAGHRLAHVLLHKLIRNSTSDHR